MLKSKFSAIATAALLTVSLSACAPTDAESPLVFAGFPYGSESDGYDPYGLLVEVLGDELGQEVIQRQAADQSVVVEGLISGSVQIAQLSPLAYVLAKNALPDLELVGVVAASATSSVDFSVYGFTKTESEINSLQELAGKRICFSDPLATPYYIPSAALLAEGISVPVSGTADAEVIFAGGLVEVALGVDRGDCDAGFINDLTYDTILPTTGKIADGSLKVFWTSGGWTAPPLVMRGDLAPEVKTRIRSIVYEKANKTWLVESGYCEDAESCQLLAPARWGWQKSDESAFDQYRELCAVLSLKECG